MLKSVEDELYPLASLSALTCFTAQEDENAVTTRRDDRKLCDGNSWVDAKAIVARDLLPPRDVAWILIAFPVATFSAAFFDAFNVNMK